MARSNAERCDAVRVASAAVSSASETRKSSSSSTSSNRLVYSRTAASPSRWTVRMISWARARMAGRDSGAGRVNAALRSAGERAFQSKIRMSGQHLFDRQDEQGTRAGLLEALQRFPEDVLAAD